MKRRPRKFADGGGIREDENENIGSDSRARAMEYLQGKRKSGEAAPSTDVSAPTPRASKPASRAVSADDESSAMRGYRATAARANARPATPSDIPTDSRPDVAASTRPRASGNSIEDRVKQNLPALGGVALPAVARGVGRLAGGLASASKQGWEAGEASKAAAREAAAAKGAANRGKAAELVGRDRAAQSSARNRSEADEGMEAARMTGEGGVRRPAAMPMKKRGGPEDLDEIRMAGEGGPNFKRGGKVKKYAAGGSVSASRRADGIAQRGRTRGKVC